MGGNLAKAPLVGVLYAAMLRFIVLFLPFTALYGQAVSDFSQNMSWLDHIWLVAYCLFASIIAAIAFANVDKSGIMAFLTLLPIFLGLQWLVPMFDAFLLGERSGLMEFKDLLFKLLHCALGTIIMLLLSMLLYSAPKRSAEEAGVKTKVKRKFKIVKLLLLLVLALPGAYFILYYVGGYFLGWRNEAVRMYYNGGADAGFFYMFITMLIEYTKYAGITLLRGLLLAGFSLLLMMRLPGKKLMFIVLNVMLYLSQVLIYLIPTPTMAWEVRLPHLISGGAVLLIYGVLSAFLLPMGYAGAGEAALSDAPLNQAKKGKAAAEPDAGDSEKESKSKRKAKR